MYPRQHKAMLMIESAVHRPTLIHTRRQLASDFSEGKNLMAAINGFTGTCEKPTSNGREEDCQNSQKDICTTHNDNSSADWGNVVFEYSKMISSAVELITMKTKYGSLAQQVAPQAHDVVSLQSISQTEWPMRVSYVPGPGTGHVALSLHCLFALFRPLRTRSTARTIIVTVFPAFLDNGLLASCQQ